MGPRETKARQAHALEIATYGDCWELREAILLDALSEALDGWRATHDALMHVNQRDPLRAAKEEKMARLRAMLDKELGPRVPNDAEMTLKYFGEKR